ncbi:MAG: ribosome recycling factor [Bacteroidia bacterium]|jgi:ribosome recycling factor|nr:ribosome recycling factor [Bacteroidota bacterium]MBP6511224.1 ribosome recycling factor [Bacteroidia bacterium]MBP7243996.1 ribosome recycling factor [Bacteroidia bacterium]
MSDIKSILANMEDHMQKAITHLEVELNKIRAGKASPAMLDGVMVDYYGAMTPLSQVASINTPEARTLVIQPWEKSLIKNIEKAIIDSNLGLAPSNDGIMIRISVPPQSEDRRKDLVKRAKAEGEHAKVGIRNLRRDANDNIKKLQKAGLPEDLAKDGEAKSQKITDDYITKVDKHLDAKEKDIMTI